MALWSLVVEIRRKRRDNRWSVRHGSLWIGIRIRRNIKVECSNGGGRRELLKTTKTA